MVVDQVCVAPPASLMVRLIAWLPVVKLRTGFVSCETEPPKFQVWLSISPCAVLVNCTLRTPGASSPSGASVCQAKPAARRTFAPLAHHDSPPAACGVETAPFSMPARATMIWLPIGVVPPFNGAIVIAYAGGGGGYMKPAVGSQV